jgi:hypothetical protein
MEKAMEEQQEYGLSEKASGSQPIVKLAKRVSEWTKYFFTLTEEEKAAAGIRDYKNDRF